MVARAAAKPAATKATAAKPAAAKGRASKVVEDEPDLLAEIEETTTSKVVEEDDEDFDLLSDMSDSDATAWMPWEDEDQPDGVQGKLVHIGTVTQDAKYGGDEVPYWELQDKNDEDVVWGVRGYGTVLRNQMEREQDKGLRTGDIAALKHLGMISNRKGDNEYRNFVVKTKAVGH